MKKVMLLTILSLFVISGLMAQSDTSKQRSVLVQDIDTVKCNETKIINERLTSFYRANKSSQFFVAAGVILYTVSVLTNNPTSKEVNALPIFAGASMAIGGIIYIDSFKYLNMNKKMKLRKATRRIN